MIQAKKTDNPMITGTAYAAVLPSLIHPLGTSLEKSYAAPALLFVDEAVLLVADVLLEVDVGDAANVEEGEDRGVYVAILDRVTIAPLAKEGAFEELLDAVE